MEIKNLINFAAQCNTEESARQLFDKLEEAFSLAACRTISRVK